MIGEDNFFTKQAFLFAYGGIPGESNFPLAVARPRHIKQLASMLSYCSEEKLPVVIAGAQTGIWNRSYAGAILLLTTGLDRIYEISRENRETFLQAGVTTQKLAKECAKKVYFIH